MNLLTDVVLGDPVSTKKLSIQGQTKIFDVYRIPIEYLLYNKKNGRIATYVSQFIDEGKEFPQNNIEEFNNIIEKYIENSNPEALKKTKANIRIMSQTEPAVVMENGIILDGNRRFTSLRQLTKEGAGAEFAYLEAVILPSDKYTEKDIKRLELNLQHAIESKVDYNPIDRLVDIYRDLIEDKAFTPEEYATETQISVRKINEDIEVAKLMVEYLAYIEQPKKFYIAREQKIDGPIREVYKILKSNKVNLNDDNEIKELLFLNILSLDGDVSRRIRDLKPVLEDKKSREAILNDFEENEIFDDANDFFESSSTKEDVKKNRVINFEKGLKKQVSNLTETYVESKKISKAKNQPIEILNKVLILIKEVDIEAVERMDNNLKNNFKTSLENISQQIQKLENL
ncbi:TPA: ParB/RepB/Spo0J family partition protein [Streptococcus suis]|nr:ParB/RepB/Spo0J family partition protein [Streptococcus suis]NQQ56106.1 ParB/RepB/Spo0J family partition protein [Streptococcus suis]HEM5583117.1 ParB/RepB/Spo0J family partition protein [Streptococcus suis]HEP1826337.1 ParB/RepB/Spo0J family partition protein [Streptococcus suis]HEP1842471.1 ParB/RepB/Spo0J family partition protein [Streptococcus suis]